LDEAVLMPVLVVRDLLTRHVAFIPVPSKGVNTHAVTTLTDVIVHLAHTRICFKSDNESALVALLTQVKKNAATVGIGISLESCAVGDSRANGAAEACVQVMQGFVRTLMSALSSSLGCLVDSKSRAVPWIVKYAGHLLNVHQRANDGRTAYERLRNRRHTAVVLPFGEAVEFQLRIKAKLDLRYKRGIFVGVVDSSLEKIVMCDEGVFRVRNIKRVAPSERWNAEFFQRCLITSPYKLFDYSKTCDDDFIGDASLPPPPPFYFSRFLWWCWWWWWW